MKTGQNEMVRLLAGCKLRAVAEMLGIDLEELVARVLDGRAAWNAKRETATSRPRIDELVEPELGELLGRVDYNSFHTIADQWLFFTVLARENGNVTRAARRLGASRRTVREWRNRLDAPVAFPDGTGHPPSAPPPSLRGLLNEGKTHPEIRRLLNLWLIQETLDFCGGNITRAAETLGMSRKDLRDRLHRAQGRPETLSDAGVHVAVVVDPPIDADNDNPLVVDPSIALPAGEVRPASAASQ